MSIKIKDVMYKDVETTATAGLVRFTLYRVGMPGMPATEVGHADVSQGAPVVFDMTDPGDYYISGQRLDINVLPISVPVNSNTVTINAPIKLNIVQVPDAITIEMV